ncbi:MAG TPA: response regulator transcription factor [Verrucomicrobiae bacterium]|nr:response regulator transcription factor [Verrucomicrobiae bacterium]
MSAYRIVLADDHVLLRQGLRGIISGVQDLEVIGEAGDGIELLALLSTLKPDMVIVDISMPRLRGLEVLSSIRRKCTDAKILILTMHKEYVHQAIAGGADGYLLKEDADRDLFTAVETIRHGGVYLSSRLAADSTGAADQGPLSKREREILNLVAEGRSSREVAELLFISVRTVETHRAHIMGKLGLNSTADLVKYAIQKGLV